VRGPGREETTDDRERGGSAQHSEICAIQPLSPCLQSHSSTPFLRGSGGRNPARGETSGVLTEGLRDPQRAQTHGPGRFRARPRGKHFRDKGGHMDSWEWLVLFVAIAAVLVLTYALVRIRHRRTHLKE